MVLRLHTFLFADLVGFTRFTAEHGDERGADLAVRFHRRMRLLAAELDCQVVKVIGDGVMVRAEDGRAALELGRRIVADAQREGFPPVRVGIDTGLAVEREGDWFGSTVNTAARVAAAAGAGELLLTERTRNAAGGVSALALSEHGRRALKGVGEQLLFAHPALERG